MENQHLHEAPVFVPAGPNHRSKGNPEWDLGNRPPEVSTRVPG
jgi:hypothetical protein